MLPQAQNYSFSEICMVLFVMVGQTRLLLEILQVLWLSLNLGDPKMSFFVTVY